MIEEWNPFYSYEHFYSLCSPNYCIYTEKIYKKIYKNNLIEIIIVFFTFNYWWSYRIFKINSTLSN